MKGKRAGRGTGATLAVLQNSVAKFWSISSLWRELLATVDYVVPGTPQKEYPASGQIHNRSEGALTRKPDLVSLCPLGSECESIADVRLFEVGKIGEQLLDRAAGRKGLDDHACRHTHSSNARFTAHDIGIHRNAAELVHVVMIMH